MRCQRFKRIFSENVLANDHSTIIAAALVGAQTALIATCCHKSQFDTDDDASSVEAQVSADIVVVTSSA